MLLVNEHAFDGPVAAAAARHAVPAALLLAVIAHESRFNPDAIRAEPQINDASRGLMQLLYGTARGLGYGGQPDGLFDPATNIELGAQYLSEQYRRTGEWAAALSAYNGGYRPGIGFGKRATAPLTVCVQRDAAGECIRTQPVPVGAFANQAYVDAVLGYYAHYRADPPEQLVAPADAATPASPTPGCLGMVCGLLTLGATALYLIVRA